MSHGHWVEQYRLLESQQKSNDQNGTNLEPVWTRRKERLLIKCMIMCQVTQYGPE